MEEPSGPGGTRPAAAGAPLFAVLLAAATWCPASALDSLGAPAEFLRARLQVGALHAAMALALLTGAAVWGRRRPRHLGPALAAALLLQAAAAAPFALQAGDPAALAARPPELEAPPPGPRLVTPLGHDPREGGQGLDAIDLLQWREGRSGRPSTNVAAGVESLATYTGLTSLLDALRAAAQAAAGPRALDGGQLLVWELPHRPWASFAEAVQLAPGREAAAALLGQALAGGRPEVILESGEPPRLSPGRVRRLGRADALPARARAAPPGRFPARMSRPAPKAALAGAATCFFLSGAAGLLYEVVWTRLLGLAFGHTVYAVTTVLAAYMGGLALGSFALGRRADRLRRPLRVYALLEAVIGLWCATTPWLFQRADALYVQAHRALQPSAPAALALQFGLSALLLIAPTTLMGATLPVLSRAVVESRALAASRVGWLYAINTAGAVAGTLSTGLFLLPAIGLEHTVALGVGLNLLVAALALLLERRLIPEAGGAAAPASAPPAPRPPAQAPPHLVAALVAAGVSGAASMAYEVAWTRTLSLVLGSSTYAFTAMLATFLVGLALGAFAVARLLRNRTLGLDTFGALQLGIALTAVALLPCFGLLPGAALSLLGRMGVSAGAALAVQFGLSFAVVILPTLLIGGTFPVMVGALARDLDHLGRDVGTVYGANTLGTILGSIAAGFFLVPAIGIQGTVLAAAGANLMAGAALLLLTGGPRRWQAPAGALVAWALLALLLPRWDQKVMTAGVTVYAQDYLKDGAAFARSQSERALLLYSEGISTTVAVERSNDVLAVRVNGKVDASNEGDMPTQVLIGHLGALLHPAPRRALVVGLASGVTVGAMTQHPLQAIDVAELEPAMLEVSRFFEKENRGALRDARVRLLHGDGRHILAAAASPYDLIVSEPSNPWIAGIASLFTKDFYELARSRLSPRGVFVQWLQGYGIFTRDMQMVVRTLQEVFPHVSIWTAAAGDFLLVATPEALRIDLADLERRVAASPGLREDFERFEWSGGRLLHRFFVDEVGARRYAAGAPLNTDDLPLLEFRAPLAVYATSLPANAAELRARRTVERAPVVAGAAVPQGVQANLAAARAYWRLGWLGEADAELARTGALAAGDGAEQLERGRLLVLLGRFQDALADLSEAARLRPADADASARLRAALDLRARPPGEAGFLLTVVERCMEGGERGHCLFARDQLEVALSLLPDGVTALTNASGVLYRLGDLPRAEAYLRRAAAVDPRSANTRFNLGLVLEKQGRAAEAAAEYVETLRLEPARPGVRQRLLGLGEPGLAAARTLPAAPR